MVVLTRGRIEKYTHPALTFKAIVSFFFNEIPIINCPGINFFGLASLHGEPADKVFFVKQVACNMCHPCSVVVFAIKVGAVCKELEIFHGTVFSSSLNVNNG